MIERMEKRPNPVDSNYNSNNREQRQGSNKCSPCTPGVSRARRGYLRYNHQRRAHAGFTLIEIMVALAIFMLMMTIILVPINLSIDLLHIGRARSEVQQASQMTVNQIERELRQAVYVFPNSHVPGVTDRYPYKSGATSEAPYYDMDGITVIDKAFINDSNQGVCSTGINRRSNRARIDFLIPRRVNGVLQTPLQPDYYLITYYARRLKVDQVYDPFNNPIVLFRAQVPFRQVDNISNYMAPDIASALNLNVSPTRYPLTNAPTLCNATNARNTNRGAMWLLHSERSEPNLEPLTTTGPADAEIGSHTLVTPRGMGLIAPHALNDRSPSPTPPDYTPTSSFVCEDSNGDGKIDRVQISLELGQYDTGGGDVRNGQPADQRVRFPKVVDLPNVR